MQKKTNEVVSVMPVLWLAVSVMCVSSYILPKNVSQDINYRLPSHFKPEYYIIKIVPNMKGDTFDGEVEMRLVYYLTAKFKTITLHCQNLDIKTATIRPLLSTSIPLLHSKAVKQDFCIFTTRGQEIKLKNYRFDLIISYTGHYTTDMFGFYKSSYTDNAGKTRWLGVTQLSPIHARRVFPCFDEPNFKATFTISIKRSGNLQAISNMPRIQDGNNEWDSFTSSTVKIPPYMVAFVISDFKYKKKDKFAVWAREGAIDQASYSLSVAPKVLKQMEEFLEVDYFLPKMDQVAVPDMELGATEGLALCTYREVLLLYDQKKCSTVNKQFILTAMAHGFSQQWFGGLVTPAWWNVTWLNKGFAGYFTYFGAHQVEQDWGLMEQFVTTPLHRALLEGSSKDSPPMTVHVNTSHDILNALGTIGYYKAASVIRMMEHFLTTKVFRSGLKKYLTTFANSTANDDDLFDAMNEEFKKANPQMHLDVKSVMLTWTHTAGYPILTIREIGTTKLQITQKRFIIEEMTMKANTQWIIPLTYTSEGKPFDNTSTKIWMTESSMEIPRPGGSDEWYIFNVQQVGLYRVNYSKENWNRLIRYLNSKDRTKLSRVNRAQLLDDALNLARAGTLKFTIALQIGATLIHERNFIVWEAAYNSLQYLDNRLYTMTDSSIYSYYQDYVRRFVIEMYHVVEFKVKEDDTHQMRLLRDLILRWACDMYYYPCVRRARALINDDFHDGIHPDLQRVVYCIALRHGGPEEWRYLWNKYLKSNIAIQKNMILKCLGCGRRGELVVELLMKVFENDTDIRKQDHNVVFNSIFASYEGASIAFFHLKRNFKRLKKLCSSCVMKIINAKALWISTESDYEQFKVDVEGMDLLEYKQDVRRIADETEATISWVAKHHNELLKFLMQYRSTKRVGRSHSEPCITSFQRVKLFVLVFVQVYLYSLF